MGKGSGVAVSCGVGCRQGLDLAWLWLWPAATALVQPLAWEHPYAAGVALKRQKKKVICYEKYILAAIPIKKKKEGTNINYIRNENILKYKIY